MDVDGLDLGGGVTGSLGGNVLSCNTQNDFWTNVSGTIHLANNYWDHVPPSGNDFYTFIGTLDTTGAQLASVLPGFTVCP